MPGDQAQQFTAGVAARSRYRYLEAHSYKYALLCKFMHDTFAQPSGRIRLLASAARLDPPAGSTRGA